MFVRPKINLDGVFKVDEEIEVKKSRPDRWTAQRQKDGTPMTALKPTRFVPPAVGPDLYIGDAKIEKSEPKPEPWEDYSLAKSIILEYLSTPEKPVFDSKKVTESLEKSVTGLKAFIGE